MRRKPWSLLAAFFACAVACSSFTTDEEHGASSSDGGADVTGGDGGAADGAPNGASCPTGRGPSMVRAGTFCIDSTEVSIRDYNAFLSAGAATNVPPACVGDSLQPYEPFPTNDDRLPATSVDWCGAWAFCDWAGKRLCGRPGGGPAPIGPGNSDNPDRSEWVSACEGPDHHAYAYGDVYDAAACANDRPSSALDEVGTLSGCVGGYPGLHDMSGNASEWEDACDPPDAADASCVIRIPAFYLGEAGTRCDAWTSLKKPRIGPNGTPALGFRCCADLRP